MCGNFPLFFLSTSLSQSRRSPAYASEGRELVLNQWFGPSLLCRYSSGPGIAEHKGMLSNLKRRCAMSPLLLMLLLSLVPFPVLAIAIVADRWMKAPHKAVS